MAEVLIDLPKLSVAIDGRKEPIIKRTRLITKTSSMPVATHEASVYTGITVAEHFRDQGKAVALIAKSMLLLSGASRKRTNSHPSQFHLRSMVSSTSTYKYSNIFQSLHHDRFIVPRSCISCHYYKDIETSITWYVQDLVTRENRGKSLVIRGKAFSVQGYEKRQSRRCKKRGNEYY